MASCLGVGGGAGVGVVVPGPGFGRRWLGVAGCGRSPLLAEGLVGPPLCPSGVSGGPAAPLVGGCWVLVLSVLVCCVCGASGACALVCGVRLWGSCRWRLWWCRLCACAGVCAVCWWCIPVPVLAFLGLVWRLCVGVGAVCRGPPPVSAVWFPTPPGWGLLVVCPPAAPFVCSPPSVSFPRRLRRCSPGAVPGPSRLSWVGGGPCRRLRSLPLVFPLWGADACTPRQRVTLLYGPSICTRSVQMDLLRSQVLQPFPTPGSGTLMVAGESLRDRRVSCLPRWTVCPTRSPSLGLSCSTCRGECSWSGPLVTPPGRCHRGPLTNGPGRIPPYCVCSGGADTVTGGGAKPLRMGPSPASPVGPFRPAPFFAVWFAVVGFPSLPGGVVVVGGVFRFSWPCCLCACPHLPWLWFSVGVCVCGAVRACVVSVLVCVLCVRGGVGVGVPSLCVGVCVCVCGRVAGAGWGLLLVWVWVWSVCAVVCPSLAGVRWLRWCVVCGVWFVVCGVRRWCVGGVVAGVWCGWSLATPGGGSCVLLPATPGWVSLPVALGVPRHSWLRVPGAVLRHSWLGFAVGGGGCSSPLLAEGTWVRFPATPGWGPLAAVVCGVWCLVCGVLVGFWLVCGVVGPSPLLAEVPVCYSPPLLAGFRCRLWWAFLATPGRGSRVRFLATLGWGPLAAVVCGVWCAAVVCWWGSGWCVVWLVPRHSWQRFLCATPRHSWLGFAAGCGGRSSPVLAEGPGCVSSPLLAGVRWRRWCVVCGVRRWCVGEVLAGVWCGWSLATPGGGSCVLLPATPGWVSPPVVVGVPRHSWRRVPGAVPRHSWLGFAVGSGVWCVVCGVWCAVCGGGVLVGLWLVCGVVGPSPLLAEVPV